MVLLTNHKRLPWAKFEGSAAALKYNRRELVNLEAALALVPGRTAVVQAGGNLGIFPKLLAESFRAVYTFEPDVENFRKLRKNAPERNIQAYCAALGPEASRCTLSRLRRDGSPINQHEGIVHIDRIGDGPTPMVTIDSFELATLDLLYLDIEGFELYALHGAVATLARCRPIVVLEVNKNLEYMGFREEDIGQFMEAHGYTFRARLTNDVVYLPRTA